MVQRRPWSGLNHREDRLSSVAACSFSPSTSETIAAGGAPLSSNRFQAIDLTSDDNFFGMLNKEIEALGSPDRQLLVHLHGYNVSFEEASLRAAQIGFDLKVPTTAFFSWPSCGTIEGYLADADRIGASEQVIADFLVRIAKETGSTGVHILAHSMGNRGLARAFQRIVAQVSLTAGLRFGHIILAAPDIEVALFQDLAKVYPHFCHRATMYVSARDKALGMFKWLQKSERAGFTPPITIVPSIDTVEVTAMDLTLLGHGYYAEADGVLGDIYDLIHYNAAPETRRRVRVALSETNLKYWVIAR